jgi:Carboxypeptidase regulatory-like domain/Polysaccharide lyase family 4, domain II
MGETLLALVLFLGFQANPSQQSTASRADLCTIEGTIIAGDTGQPLRKAWVSLRKVEGRGDTHGAGTDASGHFILKNIEPGSYRLFVSHAGYVGQGYGPNSLSNSVKTLTLAPGQQMRDISMRLTRAAAISGHIYDEDGDPVEGANVSALRYGFNEGRRQLMGAGFGRTDDLGEYRIYGLAPGSYIISASLNSHQFQFGGAGGGPSYAPVYYLNATDPSDATPVAVRAGDDFPGVDLNLQPTHTVTISGKVFNSITGQPGVGTNLSLMPHKRDQTGFFSLQFQTYVKDPQGDFKIEGVLPGSYYLVGFTQVEGKQYRSMLPLEVGDTNVSGVNLVISPGIRVRGHVEGLDKSVLPGVSVFLQPRDEAMLLANAAANLKPDGSFEVFSVSDGSYRVNVWPLPEDAYVKDIRVGDRSVLTSGIEISGGQSPGNLDIIVNPNGGRVDGTVIKNEKPFSGAAVVLIPDDAELRKDGSFYKQTTTDQNGNFSLRGVRPGEYEAYAWEKIEPGAYQDPSFMQRFKDKGNAVVVKEGSQITIQLPVLESDQPQ